MTLPPGPIFEVTENHLKLMGRIYIDQGYDDVPEVNAKRPYGNSNIVGDLLEITEPEIYKKVYDDTDGDLDSYIDQNYDRVWALHMEMDKVLQITVNLAARGELITPGLYRNPMKYNTRNWERVE